MKRDGERGASAVLVSVVLVVLFAAAMLTVDAGSLWTTRRTVITGTDAGVLAAARLFATEAADPCDGAGLAAAETEASNVLLANHPGALHNSTDTPDGFSVTLLNPCGTAGYNPGKVRFDAKLESTNAFSQMFGFNNLRAFSSSIAAWGYVTAIGDGLRPMSICDQTSLSIPDPLPAAPAAPYYPHYKLWKMLHDGVIDQTTYDAFFGTHASHYPLGSIGYENGDSPHNPNNLSPYVQPDTEGYHTVHRIRMPDPTCGVSPGNRIWVDFTDPGAGSIGTSRLREWLLNGYPGTVSLTPHDCNPSDGTAAPENCGSAPGDRAQLERALGELTCDTLTIATDCPYVFPILVMQSISAPGSNAEYEQTGFLFLVLRGFGSVQDTSVEMDYEFVDVQTTGQIGASPPNADTVPILGYQLCGADHIGDNCGF